MIPTEIDLLPRREGTSRNGWQPTADALLTMERLRQPVATDGNGFGLFLGASAPVRFAVDCHRLQPRGSIKMTCSETPSAQACYARDVVDVDGARGGPDEDRSRVGCASEADHVQDARPGVG